VTKPDETRLGRIETSLNESKAQLSRIESKLDQLIAALGSSRKETDGT
jgi:type II secretory pathway component PulM